jgi:hypothetical protein
MWPHRIWPEVLVCCLMICLANLVCGFLQYATLLFRKQLRAAEARAPWPDIIAALDRPEAGKPEVAIVPLTILSCHQKTGAEITCEGCNRLMSVYFCAAERGLGHVIVQASPLYLAARRSMGAAPQLDPVM